MIPQRKQTVIKTDHILWIPFFKESYNTVIMMVLWNWTIITNEVLRSPINSLNLLKI